MHPIFTVEFKARNGDLEFEDECVTLHGPDELFEFVAPDGGCDAIPDAVDEIHLTLLPADNAGTGAGPLQQLPATVQLGMVFISGPLGEIVETLDRIGERAGRGQLADSFLKVIGAAP